MESDHITTHGLSSDYHLLKENELSNRGNINAHFLCITSSAPLVSPYLFLCGVSILRTHSTVRHSFQGTLGLESGLWLCCAVSTETGAPLDHRGGSSRTQKLV